MFIKDDRLIELFKKITAVHFLTDYSSIDFMYPPHFIWDEFNQEKFSKLKKEFSSGNYALYAHFPFCQSRCKFCRQFSLAVKRKEPYEEYTDFLIRELRLYAKTINISSLLNIYFGGGTPTLFPLDRFFEALYKYTHINSIAQINVESTPESLNPMKLKSLKKWGVNRLLMGVQSLDPKVLKLINRSQRKSHFKKMFYCAEEIGIPVVNLELVAGLPGQTLKSFLNDLKTIIELKPESIHIYGYMNTPTTIFYKEHYQKSEKEEISQDKMIAEGRRMLRDANYIYRRDDYCLDDKFTSRNQAIAAPDYFRRFKVLGEISLGLSAMGSLALSNEYLLKTINTMDYRKYKKSLREGKLPIEKTFLLNKDEVSRAFVIKAYRNGFLKIKKESIFSERYKLEVDYLKRHGKVKIESLGKDIKILFSADDALIHSKIFYSPKVLKKCREIIEKQYPDINLRNI